MGYPKDGGRDQMERLARGSMRAPIDTNSMLDLPEYNEKKSK